MAKGERQMIIDDDMGWLYQVRDDLVRINKLIDKTEKEIIVSCENLKLLKEERQRIEKELLSEDNDVI